MQYFKFLISIIFIVSAAMVSTAQTAIERPDFTVSSLAKTLESLEANDDLTEDQKKQSHGFLETAIAALENATKNKESEALFSAELDNASKTIETLETQIAKQQSLPKPTLASSNEPMREEDLVKLEQNLIAKESGASTLRSELEGYQTGLQTLASRQVAAPNELTETRDRLGELTAQITELGEAELDPVGRARRQSLTAQKYMRATRLMALEREIAGLSEREKILTARRNLAELKLVSVDAEVKYLQGKTGQRRANEAAKVKSDTLATLALYAESHSLVQDLAGSNVALADTLVTLASDATFISKRGASIRSRLDDVESDLRVARDFIGLGNLDRQAGATLRRLSNQLQAPQAIKNQIDVTQESLIALTQKRLIAQDTLRDLPIGRPDMDLVVSLARLEDPSTLDLTLNDQTAYQSLYTQHRDMLLRVSNASSTRINEIVELQNQQKGLLTSTLELKALLDEKLLWVPSVPAVNLAWPQKVIKGALLLFSPEHINLVSREFISQSRLLWPVLLVFAIVIGSILATRQRLWADIYRREKMVGDVSHDSFWHTPMVIMACIIIALPLPIIFLFIALLFGTSDSPDPLIGDIRDTFLYLVFFSLFFLTWRAWDRDKSLFAAHYKFPDMIRTALNKNFRWFIPLAGAATAFVGLTSDNPTAEIYEGFSLFAFIISALALAVFSYRVIFPIGQNKRKNKNKDIRSHNIGGTYFKKYTPALAAIFIGVPILAILFAASGYYDTSRSLRLYSQNRSRRAASPRLAASD